MAVEELAQAHGRVQGGDLGHQRGGDGERVTAASAVDGYGQGEPLLGEVGEQQGHGGRRQGRQVGGADQQHPPRAASAGAPPRAAIPARMLDGMPRSGAGLTATASPCASPQAARGPSPGAVTSVTRPTPPARRLATTPTIVVSPQGSSGFGCPMRREAPAAGSTAAACRPEVIARRSLADLAQCLSGRARRGVRGVARAGEHVLTFLT